MFSINASATEPHPNLDEWGTVVVRNLEGSWNEWKDSVTANLLRGLADLTLLTSAKRQLHSSDIQLLGRLGQQSLIHRISYAAHLAGILGFYVDTCRNRLLPDVVATWNAVVGRDSSLAVLDIDRRDEWGGGDELRPWQISARLRAMPIVLTPLPLSLPALPYFGGQAVKAIAAIDLADDWWKHVKQISLDEALRDIVYAYVHQFVF